MDRLSELGSTRRCFVVDTDGFVRRSPDDPKHITSLAYHLADIYLEELEKALDSSEVG